MSQTRDGEQRRSLRQQHTEHTRSLIMHALAEIISQQGVQRFTVQEVADRAGISHRTVYRYFPTREALLEELAKWLDQQLRDQGAPGTPSSLEELIEVAPFIYQLFDEYEVLVRALAITYTAPQIRLRPREERSEVLERILRDAVPDASDQQLGWLFAVTRILYSNHAWIFFHDYLGMSGNEAGHAVQWAFHTLITGLREQTAREDSPSSDEAPREARKGRSRHE